MRILALAALVLGCSTAPAGYDASRPLPRDAALDAWTEAASCVDGTPQCELGGTPQCGPARWEWVEELQRCALLPVSPPVCAGTVARCVYGYEVTCVHAPRATIVNGVHVCRQ